MNRLRLLWRRFLAWWRTPWPTYPQTRAEFGVWWYAHDLPTGAHIVRELRP